MTAAEFSKLRHAGQKRRWTGEPYYEHTYRVADMVQLALNGEDPEAVDAAYLHDILEDTSTTPCEIEQEFGTRVRILVETLTEAKIGSRAQRKEHYASQLANGPAVAQTIKLADICDNAPSIIMLSTKSLNDRHFRNLWLSEKWRLLNFLMKGDIRLYAKAAKMINRELFLNMRSWD